MSEMTVIDRINSQKMLFLSYITACDGTLTIVVKGSVSRAPSPEETAACPILSGAEAVEPDKGSSFMIWFKSFAAYNVSNESYTSADDSEKFTGSLFREYSSSRYADYISKTLFAEQVLGKLTHYGICCGDQIIDVITDQPPLIKEL